MLKLLFRMLIRWLTLVPMGDFKWTPGVLLCFFKFTANRVMFLHLVLEAMLAVHWEMDNFTRDSPQVLLVIQDSKPRVSVHPWWTCKMQIKQLNWRHMCWVFTVCFVAMLCMSMDVLLAKAFVRIKTCSSCKPGDNTGTRIRWVSEWVTPSGIKEDK